MNYRMGEPEHVDEVTNPSKDSLPDKRIEAGLHCERQALPINHQFPIMEASLASGSSIFQVSIVGASPTQKVGLVPSFSIIEEGKSYRCAIRARRRPTRE